MLLTPKIVEALSRDEASGHPMDTLLVPDGDILYITNSLWTIIMTRPEDHVDARLLEWIRSNGESTHRWGSSLPDWRALVATDIDYEAKKFLPPKSPGYEDLLVQAYLGYARYDAEQLQKRIHEHSDSIYGDVVDLTAMFLAGEGRPVYAKRSKSKPWTGRTVETFWFRFDRRVIAVRATWMEALTEMGFRVMCPRETDGKPPGFLGLLHNDDADLFGFVAPARLSGVETDGKGRAINGDAAQLSWAPTDAALAVFAHMESHPLEDLPERLEDHPDLEDAREFKQLHRAIGVLRWNGWSDHAIDAAYIAARPVALQHHHHYVLAQAERYYKELSSSSMSSYWLAQLEEKLRQLCARAEKLQQLAGQDIDLGDLPAAVELLTKRNTA